MNFAKNLDIALRSLAANKLRSALTMLGVMIGVGAVVGLMSLGSGAQASITEQIESAGGSNLIVIFPGTFDNDTTAQPEPSYLYYEDYEALDRNLTNVSGIAPSYQLGVKVDYEDETVNVGLTATTPEYEQVRLHEVANGRFIRSSDRSGAARVAVLGSRTAEDLFGNANGVGRSIKIDGVLFEVVGVLVEKGDGGPNSADRLVIVPLETAYSKLLGSQSINDGQRLLTDINVAAEDPEDVDGVMVQAERIMRRQHGLKLRDELDFTLFSQEQILEAFNTILGTFTTFLAAIAGISLVVGGIGIMNIMLVSVTERTREIGLRKALGAKRRTILMQFLIETVVLSMIGGILGIALGYLIAIIATATGAIDAIVSLDAILMAFGFSAAVGIISGLYPAYRASRLRPIEALRYD